MSPGLGCSPGWLGRRGLAAVSNEVAAAEQVKVPPVPPEDEELLRVSALADCLWWEGPLGAGQPRCTGWHRGVIAKLCLPRRGGGMHSCLPFLQMCVLSQDLPEDAKHPHAQDALEQDLDSSPTSGMPQLWCITDLLSLAATCCFLLPC